MTTVPIKGLSFSEFSIGWGAMNLPPEVLIRSFLRSVMERKPSHPSPDIASLEPAIDKGVAGFIRTIPIALKYRRPAHKKLTILGDPHLNVGERFADGTEFVGARCVDGNDR